MTDPQNSPMPLSGLAPRPWWQQRAKVFAVGVILLVITSGAGLAAGGWYAMHRLKRTEAFNAALLALREHPEARNALGQQIDPGFFVTGEIDDAGGRADLMFHAQGNRAEGGVRARVERDTDTGAWRVVFLDLGTGDRKTGQTAILIGDQPPE